MKHYFSRAAIVLLSMATVFSFTACGGDDEVTPNQDQQDQQGQQGQQSDGIIHVERLELKDARQTVTLVVGEVYKLEANLYPENVTNPNVSISSSNPQVVSISGDGIVTAINAGETIVTVKTQDGGHSAWIKFKVVPDGGGIPVTAFGSYQVENGGEITLTVGEALQLTFWFEPEDATNTKLAFTLSGEEGIIEVNKNTAVITALAEGEVTVTVQTPDVETPFIFTVRVVNDEEVPESSE